jgi:hypothetical protein
LLFFDKQTSNDSSMLIFGGDEASTGLIHNEIATAATEIIVSAV